MFDIFFISKSINHPEYLKLKTKYPFIKHVDDFQTAQKKSLTGFFWVVWDDIEILDEFEFSYIPDSWSEDRVHTFLNSKWRDGVFLVPKLYEATVNEINSRHFVTRKDVDIIASNPVPYDKFVVRNYDDYLAALSTSKTVFFWMIVDVEFYRRVPKNYHISPHDLYEYSQNHAFYETDNTTVETPGVWLISKNTMLTEIEIFKNKLFDYEKKYGLLGNPYDIVFISYNEINADENYNRLLKIAPDAKRIHGVIGIHNAHIEAAKICKTDMFWAIDGDAVVVDEFNFEYEVSKWDKTTVHVWRSKNPINDLEYGYGGIKLLPTKLTINMDTSKTDMTTSISSNFKAIKDISNITAFNTDPYNTWKSAFRETCKLASRVIDRQKLDETDNRLTIWCTVGKDRSFGEYAIAGARAGSLYGRLNQNNPSKLKLINDFNWLRDQFNNANT